MASLINIGVNGLLNHQSALNTTGNNITNANTPGYSRQRVELATLPEHLAGAGYQGQGSQVTGIHRIVDQFLVNQLRHDTSSFHYTSALTTQFSQLDSLLADASTGAAPAMQAFYDALQQASLDPTSEPVRQVVLSTAGTLAQRFNALYGQLQSQERVINQQLNALAGQVTSMAQGIASLNQQISQQTAGGAQPNALLDKRDELTRQLAELVSVSVVDQGNGMVNVFIGNGQPLVVGNQAGELGTAPSSADASRHELLFTSAGSTREIGQFLNGGEIGGLLQYRSQGLDVAFNQLGQMALSIAEQFNQLQQNGMDLDGNYGAALDTPNIFADINSPELMAGRSVRSSSNSSPARVSVEITDASRVAAREFTATYLGGSPPRWGVEPGGDPAGYNDTELQAAFGLSFAATSTPAINDSFVIKPTRQGANALQVAMTDPRDLALARAPLTVDGGSSNGAMAVQPVAAGVVLGDHPALDGLEISVGAGGIVTVAGMTLTTGSDTLTPDATNYLTITAVAGGGYEARIESGTLTPAAGDVVRLELSDATAAGDNFTLAVTENGSGTSDNRNALDFLDTRMTRLVGLNSDGSGGQTFADSYGNLVAGIGTRTAELKINLEASDSILAQAQANRDSTSGVNLDEEAANLIRFEQAYNASAQVISVARSLFDSLLSAFR